MDKYGTDNIRCIKCNAVVEPGAGLTCEACQKKALEQLQKQANASNDKSIRSASEEPTELGW